MRVNGEQPVAPTPARPPENGAEAPPVTASGHATPPESAPLRATPPVIRFDEVLLDPSLGPGAAPAGPRTFVAVPDPPRHWWLRRLVWAGVAYLVLLVAVRVGWDWEAQRRLDALVARCRALGQPVLLEDFHRPLIPDEENAAILFEQAWSSINLSEEEAEWLMACCEDASDVAAHPQRVAQIVEQSCEAHDLLREGLRRPKCRWGPDDSLPLREGRSFVVGKALLIQRALLLRARFQLLTGEQDEAVRTLLDLLDLSRALRGASVPPYWTAVGAREVVDFIEELGSELFGEPPAGRGAVRGADRRDLHRLIEALNDERALRDAAEKSIAFYRLYGLDEARCLYEGSVELKDVFPPRRIWEPRVAAPENFYGRPPSALLRPMYLLDGLRNAELATDVIASLVAESLPASMTNLRIPTPRYTEPCFRDITSFQSVTLSSWSDPDWYYIELARRRMAAVAIALRLFELECGKRAESLDALVPAYLNSVPFDPLRKERQPIGYLPDADPPRLYSVGVNGCDEGGRGAEFPSRYNIFQQPDIPFYLTRMPFETPWFHGPPQPKSD